MFVANTNTKECHSRSPLWTVLHAAVWDKDISVGFAPNSLQQYLHLQTSHSVHNPLDALRTTTVTVTKTTQQKNSNKKQGGGAG
jgi:hypothetical protein